MWDRGGSLLVRLLKDRFDVCDGISFFAFFLVVTEEASLIEAVLADHIAIFKVCASQTLGAYRLLFEGLLLHRHKLFRGLFDLRSWWLGVWRNEL